MGQERVSTSPARWARVALIHAFATIVLAGAMPAARAQGPRSLLAVVDGAIDRSTVDYLQEAIDEARGGGYAARMIRFATPGGGPAAAVALAEMLNNAPGVPVLGMVGPGGA